MSSSVPENIVAHTPGPWTYIIDTVPGSEASAAFFVGPIDGVSPCVAVVEAREDEGLTGPTVEANARLIAAAPRMTDYIRLHAASDPEARAILQEAGVLP